MTSYDVFGVGNALVDIQARVEDSVISDLQLDKGIMTLVEHDQQQRVLATLNGRPLNRCAGGSAANTIVAVADFGGSAAFVGKVGNDETGEFFLKDMRDLGVAIDVQPADAPSGTCAVLITSDAQRTMLTHLGASVTLTEADIHEPLIQAAKYVYIEGYLLTGETTKAAAYRAMDLAKKNNVKVAFTASDPFLVNMIRDEIWDLITGPVDLFFCNEEEAKSLTGQEDPDRLCGEDSRTRRERRPDLGTERFDRDARRSILSHRRGRHQSDRHHRRRRHVCRSLAVRNHQRPELEASRARRLARRRKDRRTNGCPPRPQVHAGRTAATQRRLTWQRVLVVTHIFSGAIA